MCLSSYYELRSCQPKTGKLRQLLAESPYRGPEYEIEGSEDIGRELEVDGERMEGWNGEKEAKRRKIDKNQPRKVNKIVCYRVYVLPFSLTVHFLRFTECCAG